MITHHIIQIPAKSYGVHLITDEVVKRANLKGDGMLHLFIQHTSAALALNENASPDVLQDVHRYFCELVPEGGHYQHKDEGPDDMPAHIKSILCGSALTIPFQNGALLLGVWQGIYLMEFRRNAASRKIVISHLT